MISINGYWVDERNNRWSEYAYTEEQAIECSKSLIDCSYCINCKYCKYCDGCNDCVSCINCSNCKFCDDCIKCYYCEFCNYCSHCNYCKYCYDCSNYITQPQIYTTDRIGSRNDKTRFYYGNDNNTIDNLQVVCGCFKGNLEEFEQAVRETHKNNDVYRNQYLKEIKKVKVMFKLEGKQI